MYDGVWGISYLIGSETSRVKGSVSLIFGNERIWRFTCSPTFRQRGEVKRIGLKSGAVRRSESKRVSFLSGSGGYTDIINGSKELIPGFEVRDIFCVFYQINLIFISSSSTVN